MVFYVFASLQVHALLKDLVHKAISETLVHFLLNYISFRFLLKDLVHKASIKNCCPFLKSQNKYSMFSHEHSIVECPIVKN